MYVSRAGVAFVVLMGDEEEEGEWKRQAVEERLLNDAIFEGPEICVVCFALNANSENPA